MTDRAKIDGALSLYIQKLREAGADLHGLLLLKGDALEKSYFSEGHAPDELHPMYSIAKSMVSIAIGLLADEGRLKLSDRIADHFPEYVPDNADPMILKMTIRDLLMMRTCHCKTTYKADLSKNWAQSFFITPPDHEPGTSFHYDTSAAHVLGALVEKFTGEELWTYFTGKLSPLSFSGGAHLTKDPFGVSDGGSGLVCTIEDLAEFSRLIRGSGSVCGRRILSPAYLKEALSNLTDVSSSSVTPGRSIGYGYCFWISEIGAPMCFGMNGQFIIFCPDKDCTLITTADASKDKKLPGLIPDLFFEILYPVL